MGLFQKLKDSLKKTKDSFLGRIDKMLGAFTKIDEDLFEELEETLIMSDIGVNTSMRICEELRERVKIQKIEDPTQIKGLLKEVISEMLGEDTPLDLSTSPSVILVIVVNGVGKTTTIGKLAYKLNN